MSSRISPLAPFPKKVAEKGGRNLRSLWSRLGKRLILCDAHSEPQLFQQPANELVR
jgi:hypothetical protein